MSNSWNHASGKHYFEYSSPASISSLGSPSSTSSSSSGLGYSPPRYSDAKTIPLPLQDASIQLQIHPILCTHSAISGRLNMLVPLERSLGVPGFVTPHTLSQSAVTPVRSRIHVFLREIGLTISVGSSSYAYVSVYDVIRALHNQLLCRIPSGSSSLIESTTPAHQIRCAQYESDPAYAASELAKGPRFIDAFRGKCFWYGLKVYDPTPGAEILALQLC